MNTFHTAIHIALHLKREYHRNEWDNRTHNEFGGGTKKRIYQKKNSGTNYCKTNNVHGKTFATNWTCIHVVSYYFIPFWFIFCGWRARICNTLKFIFLNLYHAMTNRNRQEKRARKEEKKRNCESFASSQQIVWMEGKKHLAFCRGPQAYSIGSLPSVKLANLAIYYTEYSFYKLIFLYIR